MSYVPQGTILGGLQFQSTEVTFDATTVGQTSLFVVPTGKTFVPTYLTVTTTSVSGFVAGPTVTSGANSPTYNDLGPISVDSLTGSISSLNPIVFGVFYSGGTDIKIDVTVAALATTLDAKVILVGYYM